MQPGSSILQRAHRRSALSRLLMAANLPQWHSTGMKLQPLSPARSVLMVVDIQEKLIAAMPDQIAAMAVKNAAILVAAARALGVPVVATEQYPQGLGHTVEALATPLAAAGATVFPKIEFSAVATQAFADLYPALGGRDQWVCLGVETHICLWQTVRDLRGRGLQTHVVADASLSRTKANWRAGLALATQADALVTSTEAVLFDWLGRAGTPQFKELSKLIR